MRSTVLCLLLSLLPIYSFAADVVTYEVKGLNKPAEILVDEWGIPHIYADDHYDAFFVQGFNAARDRLWQIDLWRKRGLGQLSSVLGEAFLEQDKAARLFLYRGHMFQEWLAYGNDAKKIATAFTAGINAYIRLTEQNPDLLPVEFTVLDYKPSTWMPSDVVRIRSNGLWRNVTSEAHRAQMVCQFGLETEKARYKLEPDWETVVPEGLDPCDVPEGVDRLYRLAKAPVDFSRAVQFAGKDSRTATELSATFSALHERDYGAGSNNWAVAPAKTATGRPVLANDPHRGHAVPSLRYAAHLVAPGLNVIGAGEPALPGISIGHNEKIAFGLTIFSIDQEDLMVYRTKRDRYRYKGQWHAFTEVEEQFAVRGGVTVTQTLRFTHHGPVIHSEKKQAFAVQAAWLEPGMAPYFGSIEYMRAQNWNEFLGALNRWGAPSENQVYADTDGNIGYKPAGLMPVRHNYDGLMPVPGDGTYEWDGFYDMDVLPVEYNPERQWVGTANANSLPDGYPYESIKPGFEWAAPFRINRIAEVLDATEEHTLTDSLKLQRDYLSLPARSVLTAVDIDALPTPAPELFRDWDYILTRDSAAAALFQVWMSRFLTQAIFAHMLPDVDVAQLGNLQSTRALEYFLSQSPEVRQLIAGQSLALAVTETQGLLDEDHANWQWGELHTIKFRHPLQSLVGTTLADRLDIVRVSRGGSAFTPNSTRYNNQFEVVSGGSWRMVLDVGNWDHAYMTNSPGQSGDPDSPFYDNLLQNWADDGALPLIFSREKVVEHTVQTYLLTPVDE